MNQLINKMNAENFIIEFHDFLASQLDTYEQAIYLYAIRHSRLIGSEEVVIGFSSARKSISLGSGKKGSPMSENTCYEKVRSLESKHCLEILGSERNGTRLAVFLPHEIAGVVQQKTNDSVLLLEEMDFFHVAENRTMILEREAHSCFYCLRNLDDQNYVIEHVQSRPKGDSKYWNVVAACRHCNNRKGSLPVEDHLRRLYREGFLGESEFEERITHLALLRSRDLKPKIHDGRK